MTPALVCLLASVGCEPTPTSFDRVVLIVVDTLRRDHLSLYSGAAETPAIDGLADRGAATPAAHASYHQTTMSMAAMFTGRVPALEWDAGPVPAFTFHRTSWCGMRRFGKRGDACIPASVPTLAAQFQGAGYETLGIASNPLLHAPAGYHRGFDTWQEVGHLGRIGPGAPPRVLAGSRDASVVQAAVEDVLGARRTNRFFLYVHFMDAHDWWLAGRPSYVAGVEASDAGVARLLERLEEENLLEGTLVILTADHGEMLPGDPVLVAQQGHFGNPSFEPVLDVPFIVAPAVDLAAASGVIRTDQFATRILDWAGVSPADEFAIQPILARDETFTSETGWRTYRKGHWKSAWRRDGTTAHLFDLNRGESQDLANRHPEILEQHRLRIEAIRSGLGGREPDTTTKLSPEAHELLRALGYAE